MLQLAAYSLNFKMRTKTFELLHNADTVMRKLNQDRKTDAKYCDFRISADGSTFPIHKSIVGPQSEYFDAVFFSAMKEQYQPEATVKGMTKAIIADILDFFYSGTIEITSNNVYEMMEAADYLNISAVKTFCTEFLLEEVKIENYLTLKRFSKLYDLNDLSEKVDNFIEKHFGLVITSDEFKTLEFEEMKSVLLLKKTKLGVSRTTEAARKEIETLLPALIPMLKWFKADKEKVLQLAKKLAESGCFSSDNITKLDSVSSSASIDEIFTLFISYFKESAQDKWKDHFSKTFGESIVELQEGFLKSYLEGSDFCGWFLTNWEFLQNRKDDLKLVAEHFREKIDFKEKGELWLLYFLNECWPRDDDNLLQFIQALGLVSKDSRQSSSVVSEDRVFDAVIGWVKHDVSTRTSHLRTLFSALELEAIPWDHINGVVVKEPLILESVDCMKLLVQAMAVHPRITGSNRKYSRSVYCKIM